MSDDYVRVALTGWEYEWASHVGTRRYIERWNSPNAAHYEQSRMEDNRTAQVAACVAEIAVAKHTNRYWSGHVWPAIDHKHYRHIADVGKNIEVKRLRTRSKAPVRRHQVGKGLVLFVAKPVMPELREVDIYGWRDYDEAWELARPSDYDPENTKLLDLDWLIL